MADSRHYRWGKRVAAVQRVNVPRRVSPWRTRWSTMCYSVTRIFFFSSHIPATYTSRIRLFISRLVIPLPRLPSDAHCLALSRRFFFHLARFPYSRRDTLARPLARKKNRWIVDHRGRQEHLVPDGTGGGAAPRVSGVEPSYLVAHELRRVFSSSIIYRKGERCYVHVLVAYTHTKLNF